VGNSSFVMQGIFFQDTRVLQVHEFYRISTTFWFMTIPSVRCIVLCVAFAQFCNVLHYVAVYCLLSFFFGDAVLQCVAVCCNVLQCVAV